MGREVVEIGPRVLAAAVGDPDFHHGTMIFPWGSDNYLRTGQPCEAAQQTALYMRAGVQRMARFAFELARTPRARHLTSVLVALNLEGDILSDLAGALARSLGMAPSDNVQDRLASPAEAQP